MTVIRPSAALVRGTRAEQTLMRIQVGERDRHDGRPLYRSIVELLRTRGLSGATVTRCIAGFGASRSLHSEVSDVSALDLPVVVECVDSEAKIQSVLPDLDRMIRGGLITLERATVILYRAHGGEAGPGGTS